MKVLNKWRSKWLERFSFRRPTSDIAERSLFRFSELVTLPSPVPSDSGTPSYASSFQCSSISLEWKQLLGIYADLPCQPCVSGRGLTSLCHTYSLYLDWYWFASSRFTLIYSGWIHGLWARKTSGCVAELQKVLKVESGQIRWFYSGFRPEVSRSPPTPFDFLSIWFRRIWYRWTTLCKTSKRCGRGAWVHVCHIRTAVTIWVYHDRKLQARDPSWSFISSLKQRSNSERLGWICQTGSWAYQRIVRQERCWSYRSYAGACDLTGRLRFLIVSIFMLER